MTVRRSSNDPAPALLQTWQLAVLAAGTFALGMDAFVFVGLLPSVAGDLHVTVAEAGQLSTIFALTYAIGSPVIATVAGRVERRLLLGGGLVAFLVGMALQALGQTFGVVAGGRVLAALGAAAFQSNAYVMAGMMSDDAGRGRALAVVTAGSALSGVLGVPFGVVIGGWVGWRGAAWVIVGLAAVAAAAVPALPRLHVPRTSMRTRLAVLRRPPVLVVLLTTVAVLVPPYLVISYLPAFLDTTSTVRIVVALMALGLGQVCGNRLVGRLVDERGAVPVLTYGTAGLLVLLVAVAIAQEWYAAIVVLFLALGTVSGLTITPQQHRLFGIAGDAAPVALGLNGSAIYAGFALGSALGGIVLAAAGASWLPVSGAVVAFAALALVVLASPERRGRAEHDGVAASTT